MHQEGIETARYWKARAAAVLRDLDPRLADDFKYALENHVYNFGQHLRWNWEQPHHRQFTELRTSASAIAEASPWRPLALRRAKAALNRLRGAPKGLLGLRGWDGIVDPSVLAGFIQRIRSNASTLRRMPDWVEEALGEDAKAEVLLDGSYLSSGWGLSDRTRSYGPILHDNGWRLRRPPWIETPEDTRSSKLLGSILRDLDIVSKASYPIHFEPGFTEIVLAVRDLLDRFLSHPSIRGFIAPFEQPFLERTTLRTLRELGKLTIVVPHGMPACPIADTLEVAEYLVVWGGRTADLLQADGIAKERIILAPHPDLAESPTRLGPPDLHRALVLTRAQSSGTFGDRHIHQNRGDLLLYLDEIATALRKVGVRSARLRPHPSESAGWYKEFTDARFFHLDLRPLPESLAETGCVIGPGSTMILDSHRRGIPYFLYVPSYPGDGFAKGLGTHPPFDGSEPELLGATSPDELAVAFLAPPVTTSGFWEGYASTSAGYEELLSRLEPFKKGRHR